ncbi:unnamed protein product [Withania somnifera]
MVDDNSSDDGSENLMVVSDQGKGSRNKRKFVSELPLETSADSPVPSLTEFPRYELLGEMLEGGTVIQVEPLMGGCPQSDEEKDVEVSTDADWEESIVSQLLELLSQNLSTIFQSAVKRIAECGYSEEIAERVILRSGLYHGKKDAVSNIADGALALLSREKDFNTDRHLVFADLPSLVDYTLLEMIYVLREVKPALTVAEAMWWLLILDLNLVHACRMEGNILVEKWSQESPGNSSSDLKLSQSKTEASEDTRSNPDKQQLSPSIPIAQTLQSKVPVASIAPQEIKCKYSHERQMEKGEGSSVPLPEAEAEPKTAVLEDKSGADRKALNSRKDLLRRKTNHFEKNCKGRASKNIKANITAWGSLVLEKALNSSGSSGATKKSSHSKVNTSVNSNKPLAKPSSDSLYPSSSIAPATDTSSLPPMEDNVNKKDHDSLALEPKSSIKAPDNTTIPSVVPEYCSGFQYDESLGKYVPQNKIQETILVLVPHMKTLQKELQQWSDWANEKVMQATWRLGKDLAELKMLRQEKEDAERTYKEKQMLEENTMKRILEMEQMLVNTNYQIETTDSDLNRLEGENVALKKGMESLKLSAAVSARNMHNALAKEQETVKKCQAAEVEKLSLQEELSALKKKTAELQQKQQKASKRMDQYEVLRKQEERMKLWILEQAGSMKAEREQVIIQGKLEEDNIRDKAERNMQKGEDDIQKIESEMSQLRLQSERGKIEALKRGIPQMTKGASSGSADVKMERECVVCMSEPKSVVFLPCAHQILCADCNVRHEKKGMNECPSCRALIGKRINVCFPDS